MIYFSRTISRFLLPWKIKNKLAILMKYLTVILFTKVRSSRPEVFYKKGVVEKETLAQVFSCEFCEISKNTFSCRTPPAAASEKLVKA